jgi:hypothetical protein
MGGSKSMGFSKPCLKAYFPDYVFFKKTESGKRFGTPINFETPIFKGNLFRCDLVDDHDFI